MTKTKIIKTLIVLIVGSILVRGDMIAMAAEQSIADKKESTAEKIGSKIDGSIKKLSNYINDSRVTAKVKAALKNTDISVETHSGIVTLRGFLTSQGQAEKAVAVTKKIKGVKSVRDQLHVKYSYSTK